MGKSCEFIGGYDSRTFSEVYPEFWKKMIEEK